jgi:hypothetical protein
VSLAVDQTRGSCSVDAAPKKSKQLAKTVKPLPVLADSLCPQRSVLLMVPVRSMDQPEAGWVAVAENRAEKPGPSPDDGHIATGRNRPKRNGITTGRRTASLTG